MRGRLAAAAVALALAVPAAASAHARLVSTAPANGAVLVKAPTEVRVAFDDVVRVGPGNEAIRNGGGTVVDGKPRVEGGRTLVVPLKPRLPHGDYSVRWSVISDDGHFESGIVVFAVGAGSKPPSAALLARGSGPRAEDVIARWLLYAGLLGAVGTALFALATRPRDEERVALLLASFAIVSAVGGGEEAHRVGLATRAGTALGAGAIAALVVGTLAGAATLERRLLGVALPLAPLLVVPPAFAGHAYDVGVPRIDVAADALHLAGAAAWVGTLVGIVLLPDRRRRGAGRLALGGVALLAATGVVRAWSELLRLAQLWDTSYGGALIAKAAILVAALAGGWLVRRRVRTRAGLELVLVAGLLVAVSLLVLLTPGRDVVAAQAVRVSTAEPGKPPPEPARDAVVLAKELGELGVALELEPRRTTAIVLSPSGGGLDGLDVRLDGRRADDCGHGCYRVERPPGPTVDVQVDRFGATLRTTFGVPQDVRPGAALLRRVEDRYRTLRSVFYLEHLASSPDHAVDALWRLESPDRLAYQIPGGADGIVIGNRRWDRERPDQAWQESPQTQLPQPATLWDSTANAYVIGSDADTRTLTFLDPVTPAFFTVVVDVHTLLPRTVDMVAAAHFMTDRYVRFNAPRAIHPPR